MTVERLRRPGFVLVAVLLVAGALPGLVLALDNGLATRLDGVSATSLGVALLLGLAVLAFAVYVLTAVQNVADWRRERAIPEPGKLGKPLAVGATCAVVGIVAALLALGSV